MTEQFITSDILLFNVIFKNYKYTKKKNRLEKQIFLHFECV